MPWGYGEGGEASFQECESFVARSLLRDLQQEPFLKDLGCEGPRRGSSVMEDT